MRLCALLLAGLAASTLNWSGAAHSASAAAASELRLPHISVTTVGKGSPVVLIPGLSSPRAVWDGIVPQLVAGHQVILVQVNGFGGDEPGANLQPGILDGIVADLDSYIARKKLQGAAVIGHSMGGLVGLMLAKAHPKDVGKLMVVDSLPYIGDIFLPGATVAQVEPQAKMMREQMVASYGKPFAGAARTAASMALTADAQAKVTAWIGRADPRVSGEAMYEDMTTDLRPDLAAVKTPIVLVYPNPDTTSKARTDAFYHGEYAKAPNVTFLPIANAAHFVMLDQPQAFAEAVRDFVK